MTLDSSARSNPLRRRLRRLSRWERHVEAMAFVDQFHRENGLGDAERRARRREVAGDLRRHGHYEHTAEELAFGARVAWRNSARCIGRLLWRSLEVFDCRALTAPEAIAQQLVDHLVFARGDGRIRSAISVFAPVRGDVLPVWVESRQLIQYAGYAAGDGRVLGDPLTVETTQIAIAAGWRPPAERGPFDVLPLLLRDAKDRRLAFDLPPHAVQEVALAHPRCPAFGELGLRWYTVPCVSGMILTIGGIDYPCAPFNGFYMATEIASRNLADERRYDLLPRTADTFGIDRSSVLWRDRTLTELVEAVLFSFQRDGVSMVDHHTASRQYEQFAQQEAAAGRVPSGDWSWIVPPQASAATPVFHLPMADRHLVPNFYYSRALDGAALEVHHDDRERSRWRLRLERARRRWFRWRRRPD